jgi:hypothetical protein
LTSPSERSSRFLDLPPSTVSDGVAQVHDGRVEVVGEAVGGGGEAGRVQVVDERLEALFGVPFANRVIEGLPVGLLDGFAFSLGELGVQVAGAVHAAAPAV